MTMEGARKNSGQRSDSQNRRRAFERTKALQNSMWGGESRQLKWVKGRKKKLNQQGGTPSESSGNSRSGDAAGKRARLIPLRQKREPRESRGTEQQMVGETLKGIKVPGYRSR